MIESYRMALGDFEAFGSFENNPDNYMFLILFTIGSILQLLIILNMVIAVMGSSFEKVESDQEAYMLKEKLSIVLDNWFRLPRKTKDLLQEYRYLILINVDPQSSLDLEDEAQAKIVKQIKKVQTVANQVLYEQARSNYNIEFVIDKMSLERLPEGTNLRVNNEGRLIAQKLSTVKHGDGVGPIDDPFFKSIVNDDDK